ncbi:MAG: ABC transporter permease [Desulfobacterales bacterium]|nr:ABC transporter permease [Desulfobacterales bacterium]
MRYAPWVSPMEFLAPPRMPALALMMPLLGLYADVMGVLGGLIVSVGMLDISVMEYINMTRASVSLNDFRVGLFQSPVFGILASLSGCPRGMSRKKCVYYCPLTLSFPRICRCWMDGVVTAIRLTAWPRWSLAVLSATPPTL